MSRADGTSASAAACADAKASAGCAEDAEFERFLAALSPERPPVDRVPAGGSARRRAAAREQLRVRRADAVRWVFGQYACHFLRVQGACPEGDALMALFERGEAPTGLLGAPVWVRDVAALVADYLDGQPVLSLRSALQLLDLDAAVVRCAADPFSAACALLTDCAATAAAATPTARRMTAKHPVTSADADRKDAGMDRVGAWRRWAQRTVTRTSRVFFRLYSGQEQALESLPLLTTKIQRRQRGLCFNLFCPLSGQWFAHPGDSLEDRKGTAPPGTFHSFTILAQLTRVAGLAEGLASACCNADAPRDAPRHPLSDTFDQTFSDQQPHTRHFRPGTLRASRLMFTGLRCGPAVSAQKSDAAPPISQPDAARLVPPSAAESTNPGGPSDAATMDLGRPSDATAPSSATATFSADEATPRVAGSYAKYGVADPKDAPATGELIMPLSGFLRMCAWSGERFVTTLLFAHGFRPGSLEQSGPTYGPCTPPGRRMDIEKWMDWASRTVLGSMIKLGQQA